MSQQLSAPFPGRHHPGRAAFQRPIRVERDQALYECGAEAEGMLYVVRFGAFKTCRPDVDGRLRVIGFQMKNELLGLEAIGLRDHRARAVAVQDSEVYEVRHGQSQRSRAALHGLLSDAIAQASDLSLMLLACDAEQRVAAFLLNMSSRFAAAGYSPHSFRLPMARNEIAEYLGLTKESISRALGRLRAGGWIHTAGRLIVLRDQGGLAAFAGEERGTAEYAGATRLGNDAR